MVDATLREIQPMHPLQYCNPKAIPLNSVFHRHGNTTSQTGIFIKSGVGANLPFIHPNALRLVPVISRSAAMTGSADSAASSILPTVGQPIKLVNMPRRSKHLIIPEQYDRSATTDPPKQIQESELGPEYIHSWSHDQNDIGFDGIANPNPIKGLPPLDPVQQQDTIQPNGVLTNREKRTLFTTRPRKKINHAHGIRINTRMNKRMIKIQNSVNDSIWGRT